MKSVKFFNGKTFIVCFIVYLLLTITIFALSLTPASTSSEQSTFAGSLLSDAVSFITANKVNLKNDGKTQDYPHEIILEIPNRVFMVGESVQTSCDFTPNKKYADAQVQYSSSNTAVATISSNGVLKMVGVGSAQITAFVKGTEVSAVKTITVGSQVYEPTFDFEVIYSSANDEQGTHQGKYYYSEQSQVGGLYFIKYSTNLLPEDITCSADDDSAFTFFEGNNSLCFYTKKSGDFNIYFTYNYQNINGVNSISHTLPVSVINDCPFDESAEPLINASEQDLFVSTAEPYLLDYNRNASTLLSRLCITYDTSSKVKLSFLEDNPDKLSILCKSVGTYPLSIYYAGKGGLNKIDFNLIVSAPKPTSTQFISSHDFVAIDGTLSISPLGDGNLLPADSFTWSVSNDNVASVENGKLYGKSFGKVVVTATSKDYDGVVITAEFTVRRPYLYIIRKALGHFALFVILAIFASIVYYRLAEVIKTKKIFTTALLFTLLAGGVTATISEILQSGLFTLGRAPSFTDFLIDFSGFCLGYLFYAISKLIIFKKQNKKQ